MSVYKRVQFIAWEIYTGPMYENVEKIDADINPDIVATDYPGIWRKDSLSPCIDMSMYPKKIDYRKDAYGQCIDIDARVAFTKDAIEKAMSSSKINKSPDVLKIFMAPEFLYRGAGGAYIHDLINGWKGKPRPSTIDLPPDYSNWPGLFGKLKDLVNNEAYKDWLFIFGTAVSAFFPTAKTDIKDSSIVLNTALIQLGGLKTEKEDKGKSHVSRKYYVSGEDFIQFKKDTIIFRKKTTKPLENPILIPTDIIGCTEGSALFSFDDVKNEQGLKIQFGIEICLDHSFEYPVKHSDGSIKNICIGRLKTSNNYVDIQLVPSCGIFLQEDSISLRQNQIGSDPKLHSYAFNCDGSQTFVEDGFGSHVQVWEGDPNGTVLEFDNDFLMIDADLIEVTPEVTIKVYYKDRTYKNCTIDAYELWDSFHYDAGGSGYIRIMDALPLYS